MADLQSRYRTIYILALFWELFSTILLMRKGQLKYLFYMLLVVIPSVFVFGSYFRNLHLTWGDAPFYFPEGLKELVSVPLTWVDKGMSFGGSNLVLWLSPIMYLYSLLYKYLGLNNDLIIRVIFYFPSVIFAAAGPYLLTRYLKFSLIVGFFSSLFYILNTYFLLLIDGGQVGVALAYSLFPFVILFWRKLSDNTNLNTFFLFLTSTFILCYIDTRIIVISFLFIIIWQLAESILIENFKPIRKLIWLIITGIILIPLNLYWLFPLINGGSVNLSASVSELNLTSLLNTLLLFAPHWPSNIFGKVISPYFYFAFLPLLIFGSLLKKSKDRNLSPFAKHPERKLADESEEFSLRRDSAPDEAWGEDTPTVRLREASFLLAFLFLVFAFVAKGGTPPFGQWYEYFVGKVPFGSVFRDSTKFFIPLILLGGMLIGTTIEMLIGLVKSNVLKVFVFVSIYVYLLLLIAPAQLGKMNFNLGTRNESGDYEIIYNKLKNEGGFFRTLWLPEKPQMGFDTFNKPAINANDLVSFRPFATINNSEDPYNFLNNSNYVNWFRILGIRYIFLSGDQRNIFPTTSDVKNWNQITTLIGQTNGLEKVDWGTSMSAYKITDSAPEAFSLNRILAVVGPDLPLDARGIPATVYLEDGKFDPRILLGKNSDSIKVIFNKETKTDLAMSFLQKYFKAAADFKMSQWAVYAPADYLKVKYELLIRGYRYDDFDFNRGIAFSTKIGEKISFQFDVPESGNYFIAVRSSDFKTQKLSWHVEERSLEKGNFIYEVSNNSGFDILNTIGLIPENEFQDSSKLADSFVSTYGSIASPSSQDFLINNAQVNIVSPLVYKFTPGANDNWLIFTENFNSNWEPTVPVYSMVNGFYVAGQKDFVFEYKTQRYFYFGAFITGTSIITLAVVFLFFKIKRHDRRN